MSSGICREGWLTKEGGSIKSWKKRWVTLQSECIKYSKEKGSQALGTIPMSEIGKIEAANRPGKKFCLQLQTVERIYYMQAESEADMQGWIDTIKKIKQGKDQSTEDTKQLVNLHDFDLLRVVGEGSFGKVMQVRKKDSKEIFAMKVLNKGTVIKNGDVAHAKSEKSILQKLNHPFLVNLHYTFQNDKNLFFVMDFINGGEMFYHLQNENKFSEDRTRFYVAEIAVGIDYLHSKGIIYRDLKPENVLLAHDGHIRMTDFGISKEGLIGKDSRTQTFCGTPEYLAPEVIKGEPYGKEIDWWSLGTIMYEMLTGAPPFIDNDVQEMYIKILKSPIELPDDVTPEGKNLLLQLLERDPKKRLKDLPNLQKHPWFKGLDWEKLVQKQTKAPYVPPVKSADSVDMIDDEFTKQAAILPEGSIAPNQQKEFENWTFQQESAIAK